MNFQGTQQIEIQYVQKIDWFEPPSDHAFLNHSPCFNYEYYFHAHSNLNLHKPSSKNVKLQKISESEQLSTEEEQKKEKEIKGGKRYQKNICGYILKSAFNAFESPSYMKTALGFCNKYSADYLQILDFCQQNRESTNGISTIYFILTPEDDHHTKEMLALLDFVQWFADNRYLRQLIRNGKIREPEIYVKYKNTILNRQIINLRKNLMSYANGE